MKFGLDQGHGPGNTAAGVNDPGASLGAYKEANLAAGMVERLRGDLVALGHTVLVTKGALTARDDAALKAAVDFYLSIHFNGGPGTGTECFVDPAVSSKAKKFADLATSGIANTLGIRNRGVKYNWWAVLRANKHDALLEVCFPADIAKYQANVDGVELAILNALLAANLLQVVGSLPRKAVPVREFVEVRIHADKSEMAYWRSAANVQRDVVRFYPTTAESWRTWPPGA